MPHDSKPVPIKVLPVPDRQDVELALQAGFTKDEVAFMLDIPETVIVAVEPKSPDQPA